MKKPLIAQIILDMHEFWIVHIKDVSNVHNFFMFDSTLYISHVTPKKHNEIQFLKALLNFSIRESNS